MSEVWLQVVVAVLGAGGFIGAIAALFRIPSEKNNAAVTGAQGAVETMQKVNDELESAWHRATKRGDYWKGRALMAEGLLIANQLEVPRLPPPPEE